MPGRVQHPALAGCLAKSMMSCLSLSPLRPLLALLLCCCAIAHAEPADSASADATVEIRRTTDGIPHILAHSWRALGVGVGYAQAQDALCTLAQGFVTYSGQRSWYFGAEQRLPVESSLGRPRNIDSDVFFKAYADDAMVAQMRAQQPDELNALIEGYAQGYNRLVRETFRSPARFAQRDCVGQAWLKEISAADIYRRMYAVQVMAGYAPLLAELVNATPGGASGSGLGQAHDAALRLRLANNLGTRAELGSNAIAWGSQATGGDGALLFGNPHWYWGGPDRFYQMQLTLPGQINVAGAGFLGIPVVMIGFNEHVAWTHTVSRARRFGLFQLQLDPQDPQRYLVDGIAQTMQQRQITVAVHDEAGRASQISRTLYTSRFGPVLDLHDLHPSLGWTRQQALAVRDVNAGNWRIYRNFLAWGRASSLDDFIAIQRREAAMPWVNTVAIGRGDGRVWYADIGALPNVSDSLRGQCAAALSQVFARFDARTPVLDGSRSDCDWPSAPGAAQAGAMPVSRLPALLRHDYVANMNDSHWLSNPDAPLEGYASVLGEERAALSARGRLGHQIGATLATSGAASAAQLALAVQREVLRARAYTAEQFKSILLAQACAPPAAQLEQACRVLRAWGNTAEVGDRGALLWDVFWEELEKLPTDQLYAVAFDAAAPLTTPAAPTPGRAAAKAALAAAVERLQTRSVALDARPGRYRTVYSGGRHWPIYGGCGEAGYFTSGCAEKDQDALSPNAVTNSYLQVVWFGRQGVQARTLLAHGEDEQAVTGGRGSAPVVRYTRKQWLDFPFREADIARDPQLSRTVLSAP
ncbi:amidase [Herbaspirillum rubrisubalbicans M1]|uniref:penicillin acylase family protein n=1 Tax=Herbaspirillum rubrisubalbicans TaxID=80842 RepID=UPI00073AC416|nr:penicillin acylase family protein [Herbaspirillum rubrisubalbicans]ALU89451.1 amidase [Herbaspirillum rubrisubalbicans M1]